MKLRKAYAEERQIWSTTSTIIADKALKKYIYIDQIRAVFFHCSNRCNLSLSFVLFCFSFLFFLFFFFFLQGSLEPLIKAWKHSLHYLVRLRGCCSLRFRLVCRYYVAFVLRVETQHYSFRLFLPRFRVMFFCFVLFCFFFRSPRQVLSFGSYSQTTLTLTFHWQFLKGPFVLKFEIDMVFSLLFPLCLCIYITKTESRLNIAEVKSAFPAFFDPAAGV